MSTPKLMNVIDIEATCWQRNPVKGVPTVDKQGEIIEIGITVIDIKTRLITGKEAIIVLPTSTDISEYCTNLTTLTSEFVHDNGITFRDAMKILRDKYRVDRNIWASWGDWDRQIFERQCRNENIDYPFNNMHINVKALFAWKFGFNCALKKACKNLGIKFDGTAHRGVDDSYNIAKVLLRLTE